MFEFLSSKFVFGWGRCATVHQRLRRPGPLRRCRRLRRSNRAECAYKANPIWAGVTKPVRGHKRLRRSERTEFVVKADPLKGRNPCLSFFLRSLSSAGVVVRPFISVFVGTVLSAVAGAFGGAIERNVHTSQNAVLCYVVLCYVMVCYVILLQKSPI